MRAPDTLRAALGFMLDELRQNQLRVELIPSQDPDVAAQGGKVRVAVDKNPLWYQDLCARYLSTRRRKNQCGPDTAIKRQWILRLLERLAAGESTRSAYAEDLIEYARDLEEQWNTGKHTWWPI